MLFLTSTSNRSHFVCTMTSVYLVTLSQAEGTFASKRAFGEAVAAAFKAQFGERAVLQWAAAEERHQDGGLHYHMTIKLDRSRRFLTVRQRLDDQYHVKVSFSSGQGASKCLFLR